MWRGGVDGRVTTSACEVHPSWLNFTADVGSQRIAGGQSGGVHGRALT